MPKPTPTPPANGDKKEVPKEVLESDFVQKLLIDLDYQTKRAEIAENRLNDTNKLLTKMEVSRDSWESLFNDERKVSVNLQTALAESRTETAQIRVANLALLNQREIDKQYIADQKIEIKDLKRDRWKYFAGGVAVGFASGVPTGSLLAVKFNF